MKFNSVFLTLLCLSLTSGCSSAPKESVDDSTPDVTSTTLTSEEDSSSTTSITSKGTSLTSTTSEKKKVTVAAHTLKDSNPPITVGGDGEKVTEATWNSFKNGTSPKFNSHYNYTYWAYSGGYETIEAFTKNGYYMKSSAGKLYYERKSGNTFYNYISTSEGWLRQETTLDLQSKYTYRLSQEIYVHMFDFNDYEFDDFFGSYRYKDYSIGNVIQFQNGYLTYLSYTLGMNIFQIKLAFETTIDIPESYYYQ